MNNTEADKISNSISSVAMAVSNLKLDVAQHLSNIHKELQAMNERFDRDEKK